jgi:hypothetical protein
MARRDSWKKRKQDQTSILGLDPINGIKVHLKFLRSLKNDLATTKPIKKRNKKHKNK